jgi:hypothetical protein
MDRVERGSLADVVQRHCPELVGLVGADEAAFAPRR